MPRTVLLFLFSILLMNSLARAEQKPYIISGFDDVVRQAENTSLIRAAIKLFDVDKGFTGMPELYKAISSLEDSPRFVLVSAISTLFDKRIVTFLSKSDFPTNRLYLRNWLTEWSIESFKVEKIREILKEKPNRQFIVIFDNSDASINLAEKINHLFPEKVLSVYLRQVQNKILPPESIEFYTAFDIAVKEYEEGRLSSEDVFKVGQSVLREQEIGSLIPAYAICPSNYSPCGVNLSNIRDICSNVTQHIRTLCKTVPGSKRGHSGSSY